MAEIYIYDEIGPDYWGLISARSVLAELAAFNPSEPLMVRVNSPGGSMDDGTAIYNALNRWAGHVTIEIDALAASAASYFAMAGDTIRIAQNAKMMVHNPYTIVMGNAAELRKTADVLDKYTQTTAEVYAARSGKDVATVSQWLDDETWFTAEEAIEAGMADELGPLLKVAAKYRAGMFRKPPEHLGQPEPQAYDRQHVQRLERQLQLLRKRVPA